MQKKIIALAIASALTVPAMAFADTTIYGVLDAGYAKTKSDDGAGTTSEFDAFGFSTMTSSRLGFVNTEDVGNGTKVMARIETGLGSNVMAGTTETSGAPNFTKGQALAATTLGDRELNVSAMFNEGTTVKLGYGSTMIRDISLGYAPDPGGNLIGNILNNNAEYSSNRATGVTVTQALDKASVSVQLTSKTTKVTGAADAKSGNGYLIGGQYADGPIGVAAAYQNQETTDGATTDAKRKIAILAGSFDLGVAKLIAEYGTDKTDDTLDPTKNGKKATGLSIGAQAPFGDIVGFVQLSKGKVNAGNGAADQDQSGYTLGGKYNMSKASYTYVSLGQNKVDAGGKVNQFALGMVHTF